LGEAGLAVGFVIRSLLLSLIPQEAPHAVAAGQHVEPRQGENQGDENGKADENSRTQHGRRIRVAAIRRVGAAMRFKQTADLDWPSESNEAARRQILEFRPTG
jgi:hypothetical protein